MKGGRSKAAKGDSAFSVKKKIEKKAKDPNKPKRPGSAFFVFMEGFRKDFKEKNPDNKLVSVVSKAGGDTWKSMSHAEKAPYAKKAEQLKAEYLKNVEAYEKGKQKGGAKNAEMEAEESDKSRSEVNDEEVEEGEDD